jgi:hypothetical protein
VNDALFVRRFDGVRDLTCDRESLVERQSTAPNAIRQRRTRHQLHDERRLAVRLVQSIDLRDAGMVECGEHLRLASKPGEPIGIVCEGVGQNLQRDIAVELGVSGTPDLAHAAGTELGGDFARAEAGAGREGHREAARNTRPFPDLLRNGVGSPRLSRQLRARRLVAPRKDEKKSGSSPTA